MMIGDIAVIPEIGDVIIGNNPKIVKNDLSMLYKKGQDIIVVKEGEELKFKVKDIRLSFTFTEKIIINIILENSEDFVKLKVGDLVYKKRTMITQG